MSNDTGIGLGFGLHEPHDDLFSLAGQPHCQQNLLFPERLPDNQDRNKLQIIKSPRYEVLQNFLGLLLKHASSGGTGTLRIQIGGTVHGSSYGLPGKPAGPTRENLT